MLAALGWAGQTGGPPQGHPSFLIELGRESRLFKSPGLLIIHTDKA